jgi:polyisoprenoid-binding protein YceI
MSVVERVRQGLPTGTWRTDPIHSSVSFAARHMGVGTFRGQIPAFQAELIVDGDTVVLTGSARPDSIVTPDENLRGHLLAPDWFDVERYPEIRFASRRVELAGDRLEVEGDLTVKDHTVPVTLSGTLVGPEADPFGGERIGVDLEGAVDRFDLGLRWDMPLPGGGLVVGREVRLRGELELKREV